MTLIKHIWADRLVDVEMLGEKVAYSFNCQSEPEHEHVIECIFVWHDCSLELDPVRKVSPHSRNPGWTVTGVQAHDLINLDPLHLEASIYWPTCCGLHGWIRDGKWIDA